VVSVICGAVFFRIVVRKDLLLISNLRYKKLKPQGRPGLLEVSRVIIIKTALVRRGDL